MTKAIHFKTDIIGRINSSVPINTGYYYYDGLSRVYYVVPNNRGFPVLVTEDMLVSDEEAAKDKERTDIEDEIDLLHEKLRLL